MTEKVDTFDKEQEEKEKPKELGFGEMIKRLNPYNKPRHLLYTGLVLAVIQGANLPIFGWILPEAIFAMMNQDLDDMLRSTGLWVGMMALVSVLAAINTFFYKFSFGIIGQGITRHMRQITYESLISKHTGFFDSRDNNPGTLTSLLQSDIQTMNGVSQEGMGIVIESLSSIITGLIIAFIFEWKISLISLSIFPLLIFSSVI